MVFHPPFLITRFPSSRVLVLSGVVLAVIFVQGLFVTHFDGKFRSFEGWSCAYDSLGRHLLQFDASVEKSSIEWEGFDVNGRKVVYFGPFPALIRIVLNAVNPLWSCRWSRLSCLTAGALCVVLFSLMLFRKSGRGNSDVQSRFPAYEALMIAAFGIGSPLLFLLSCSWIYHEAMLWALAGSLSGILFLFRFIEDEGSSLSLWGMSAGAAVAMLSRLTFGLPFLGLAVFLFARRIAGNRTTRGIFSNMIHSALPFLPLILGAVFQLWYNYDRFGSIFQTFKWEGFYIDPLKLGGVFNLRRIPDVVSAFFGFSDAYFSLHPPFIRMVTVQYAHPELFFEWREEVVPLTLASPWLCLAGLAGLVSLWRSRGEWALKAAAVCFGVQAVLILCYLFVAQRFAAEFLPLLTLGTVFFLKKRDPVLPQKWLTGVIFVILPLYSMAATLGATLYNIGYYDIWAGFEYRERVLRLFHPEVRLEPWSGKIKYLASLTPRGGRYSLRHEKSSELRSTKGRRYPTTLVLPLNTESVYSVPEGAVFMEGIVGVSDLIIRQNKPPTIFEIRDENEDLLFRSRELLRETRPFPIRVPVAGRKEVRLIVTDRTDNPVFEYLNIGAAAFLFP